jgi:type II secretory pathway pseudopilin PulG
MVVITIISLLAALGMPTLKSVRRRSVATVLANDLRTFAAALDAHVHETGAWPTEVDAGVMPLEAASRINSGSWLRPTALGGQFNWDNNQVHAGTRFRAAIAITSTSVSAVVPDLDLLESVDRIIDDGNLSTGNFRLGADDEPVFIITP